MDDEFILSKITEKYPDFNKESDENLLKQVISVIVEDVKLIKNIEETYDVNPSELFKTIYRSYDFVFNKCFTNKIHKVIKNKSYVRKTIRKCSRGAKKAKRIKCLKK